MLRGQQVTQFQDVVIAQAHAIHAMVLNQNAAGSRVTHVQDQVHRNELALTVGAIGNNDQFGHFDHGLARIRAHLLDLFQQAEQVQVMRLMVLFFFLIQQGLAADTDARIAEHAE